MGDLRLHRGSSSFLGYYSARGRFRALQRDARGLSMADVSWALELVCVREVEAVLSPRHRELVEPVRWQGRSQVWPLTPELQDFFHTPAWRGIHDAVYNGVHYAVDVARLMQLRAGGSGGAFSGGGS